MQAIRSDLEKLLWHGAVHIWIPGSRKSAPRNDEKEKSESPVQPHSQKYSGSLLRQITCITLAIPAQHRGAFRDRHERRAGDAVDAGSATDESAHLRTVKSYGPDTPTLVSSSQEASFFGGDGGKKARSPGRVRNKL
jgi:hypothetical protein